MKIDAYFDVCCDECHKHRSTDFNKSFALNKKLLEVRCKREGWNYDKEADKNICPECAKKKNNNEENKN